RLSSELYPDGIEAVRLTNKTADGYFYSMLEDSECDIAINIDEDAFVTDWDGVMKLARKVEAEGYANAGTPDCGPGCPRYHNPIITNPFFNILNLKLIRSKYPGAREVSGFNYLSVKKQMDDAFPKELAGRVRGDFGKYDFEPYYPFFFWLAYNFKTLYLDAERHSANGDTLSTILLNHEGTPICLHAWMSRKFKVEKGHTRRIYALADEAYALQGKVRQKITLKDKIRFAAELAVRYPVKAVSRITRWPSKLRRKIDRKRLGQVSG
ncbi:MAG: hypothetical protein HUJ91_07535, partial [Bacteroidales bacterium]|nr:hypothetical protein [Bacteroidales bacterium]